MEVGLMVRSTKWMTNRKTRVKFQVPFVDDILGSTTPPCERCGFVSATQDSGVWLCRICKAKFEEKEAALEQPEQLVQGQTSPGHVIKPHSGVKCLGCGAENRSLCDHCTRC